MKAVRILTLRSFFFVIFIFNSLSAYQASSTIILFPEGTQNLALCTADTEKQSNKNDPAFMAYSKAYNMILDEKWEEAYKTLSKFLSDFPSSSYEDDVLFWRCYVMDKMGKPLSKVFSCYELFVKSYPKSKWTDDAKRNMINIGMRLVQSGHNEYLEKIKLMKQSQNAELRLAALYALQRMGDKIAIESVVNFYDTSTDKKIKRKCMYLLSSINEPAAYDKLCNIALHEPDIDLRKNAITVLTNVNSKKNLSVLKQILKSENNSSIKKTALIALSRINLPYNDVKSLVSELILKNSDTDIARTAIYALFSNNDPRNAKILYKIIKDSNNPEIQKTALQVISRYNCPGGYNSLFEKIAINSVEQATAINAIHTLFNNKTHKTEERLINIAKSSRHTRAQTEAVRMLSKFNSRRVADFLKETAANKENQNIACAAVISLEKMYYYFDDNVFIEILLKTRLPKVKQCCFSALARIGSEEAFHAIVSFYKTEKDPKLRKSAILQSMSFRSKYKLVPFLSLVAKTDADFEIRKVAINALGSIDTPEARSALRELSK